MWIRCSALPLLCSRRPTQRWRRRKEAQTRPSRLRWGTLTSRLRLGTPRGSRLRASRAPLLRRRRRNRRFRVSNASRLGQWPCLSRRARVARGKRGARGPGRPPLRNPLQEKQWDRRWQPGGMIVTGSAWDRGGGGRKGIWLGGA